VLAWVIINGFMGRDEKINCFIIVSFVLFVTYAL